MRERNEIYKTKSIGYRGEAYNSLAKSSSLTIITKNQESDHAWKVLFNSKGQIQNIQKDFNLKDYGTII